jgi:hypothetical protein
MNLFGADIDNALIIWWNDIFVPELKAKYGDDFSFAAFVLRNGHQVRWDWRPEASVCYARLSAGDQQRINDAEGLFANAFHKLRFTLRTSLNSSMARTRPDLLEPGDFPFAGAINYRNYVGSGSGLSEESDGWVMERIIDKIIELRSAAAAPAVAASKARVAGWKYLDGNPADLDTWRGAQD